MLKPAIEPICFSVKPLEGRYIDNFEKYGTGLMNCSKETQVNGKFPLNVITTDEGVLESKIFMIKKPNKKEKGFQNIHLSVKPVELIQHLIQLFTREGATVLNPFMGSGTTAVACVRSKRKYLGFEIN